MYANQIRAARALLNWSQNDLVKRTGLSLTTIRRMEDDGIGPDRSSAGNVALVERTLEDAGVLFQDNGEMLSGGPGVRLNALKFDLPSSRRELEAARKLGREAYHEDSVRGLDRNPYTNGTDLSDAFETGFGEEAEKGQD